MLLRTLLLAALNFQGVVGQDSPVLSGDQAFQAAGVSGALDGQESSSSWDAAAPGIDQNGNVVDSNGTSLEGDLPDCPSVPLMPQRFFLRREFWGLRNTVTVKDRKGLTLLTIRSKFFEWAHMDRLWRFSGANLYKDKEGAAGRGWKYNSFMASDNEYMGSSSGTPYDLQVLDCNKRVVSKTHANQIYRSSYMTEQSKSGFFTITTGVPSANEVIIFDLSQPIPQTLVKFEQREPCWMWPMCTYLTDRGFAAMLPWVAREWTGEVVQKGYGQVIGAFSTSDGEGFEESMGANAAIDIRFLALWSTHIFGATKFSPAQQWFMGLFFIFGSTWCCAHFCFRKPVEAREAKIEEEEDVYASRNINGSSKYETPWNCCSRKKVEQNYSTTITGYSVSQLVQEMKTTGADQQTINKCLDGDDPKESLIEAVKWQKTASLYGSNLGTRRALE